MKKDETLTNSVIKRIEERIFSGEMPIGEKLPSEREIAQSMNISRIIVHSGLVELAAKGVITIVPRVGAFVNDFKQHSDLNILGLMCNRDKLDPAVAESLIHFRYLLEVESARLAARNRTNSDIKTLRLIIKEEDWLEEDEIDRMTELDFRFHHQIAIMSRNVIYPAVIQSMEKMYKSHVYAFYDTSRQHKQVLEFHKELYETIFEKNETRTVEVMYGMLKHGEEQVRKFGIII